MLSADFHIHTKFCDGADTPEQMADEALRLGLKALGFSGHVESGVVMDVSAYFTEIGRLQQQFKGKLDIIRGVELDNLYDPAAAADAEYVIGSTHYIDASHIGDQASAGFVRAGEHGDIKTSDVWPVAVDSSPEQMRVLGEQIYGGDYYKLSKDYYELEAHVADRIHPTFIGHFDLVTRYNDQMHYLDESDNRYLGPALDAMEYLVSKDIPFEINCGAANRGRKKELYPNMTLLRALYGFGGRIIINSDAHDKSRIAACFDKAQAAALSCGFRYTDVLAHDEDGSVVWKQIDLRGESSGHGNV